MITDTQMTLGMVIMAIMFFAVLFAVIDGIYSDYKQMNAYKSELDKINNK